MDRIINIATKVNDLTYDLTYDLTIDADVEIEEFGVNITLSESAVIDIIDFMIENNLSKEDLELLKKMAL